MLRLALSCGGVWLLTFEGGIQCMHAPPDKIHVLEQLGEFRNNLSAPERLDPLISSWSIDLRPWPSTCTAPGSWKRPSLMPNRLCMAPLKPQNRMIRTRRGRAQGGCSWFCKQALPAATTVSSGRCQGSTAQFHAAPIQRRGICLETPGAPVVLRP